MLSWEQAQDQKAYSSVPNTNQLINECQPHWNCCSYHWTTTDLLGNTAAIECNQVLRHEVFGWDVKDTETMKHVGVAKYDQQVGAYLQHQHLI